MRRIPEQRSAVQLSRRRTLTPASPEFSTSGIVLGMAVSSSTSVPAANDPYAYRFRLSEAAIVDQLGILHGSAAGDNFDVGVYDDVAGVPTNRLVSTGSTGAVGNNTFQFVDVTDTPLAAYTFYWLVSARSSGTSNRARAWATVADAKTLGICGVIGSNTDSFPLADPLTNMNANNATSVFVVGMSLRDPF